MPPQHLKKDLLHHSCLHLYPHMLPPKVDHFTLAHGHCASPASKLKTGLPQSVVHGAGFSKPRKMCKLKKPRTRLLAGTSRMEQIFPILKHLLVHFCTQFKVMAISFEALYYIDELYLLVMFFGSRLKET